MSVLKQYYETQAVSIIRNLNQRGMEGYYCPNSKAAVEKALSFLSKGVSVSFGGSVTLEESGMLAALRQGEFELIDRTLAKTPEERKESYRRAFSADFYFMSSNAITMDGQLVNIDGTGNRAAALVYGPDTVILLVGMNKVVKTLEEAISRVHEKAAPPNTMRLNMQTPCSKTGTCANCLSKDCICAQTVLTRFNRIPGRIKVLLIGESLGY
jgi:hypothetical protein